MQTLDYKPHVLTVNPAIQQYAYTFEVGINSSISIQITTDDEDFFLNPAYYAVTDGIVTINQDILDAYSGATLTIHRITSDKQYVSFNSYEGIDKVAMEKQLDNFSRRLQELAWYLEISEIPAIIDSTMIDVDAVLNDNIAVGAVTGDKITARTIVAEHVAFNTITAQEIAAKTITASQIAAETITATEIAAGSITASEIAAGSITADKLDATNAIFQEIQTGALTSVSIDTTDLWAQNANIQNLSVGTIDAAQINVGTLDIARISMDDLFAQTATITGSLSAGGVTIDQSGIAGANFTLGATSTISGWHLSNDHIMSATSGARIDLDKFNNRVSVWGSDTTEPKTASGYLGGLSDPSNRTQTLDSSVYGHWAAEGDSIKFYGDARLEAGQWLLEQDASIDINDAQGDYLARYGSVNGQVGLHFANGDGTYDGGIWVNGAGAAQIRSSDSFEVYTGSTSPTNGTLSLTVDETTTTVIGTLEVSRINNHEIAHSSIELAKYSTGDRHSFVDLWSNDTDTDYSARIIKWAPSANGGRFDITNQHNPMRFNNVEAEPFQFYVNHHDVLTLDKYSSHHKGTLYIAPDADGNNTYLRTDAPLSGQSGVIFQENGTSKQGIFYSGSGNNLRVYNYNTSGNTIELPDAGGVNITGPLTNSRTDMPNWTTGFREHKQITSTGWYEIARIGTPFTDGGGNAFGTFVLYGTGGGNHTTLKFNAAHHYGSDNNITLLTNSCYASRQTFAALRIMSAGTYAGASLQVYIDAYSSPNCYVMMESGRYWSLSDFTTIPSGGTVETALKNIGTDNYISAIAHDGDTRFTVGETGDTCITSSGMAQLRLRHGSTDDVLFRHDGGNFYILLSDGQGTNGAYQSWNTLRPFAINIGTGDVKIDTILDVKNNIKVRDRQVPTVTVSSSPPSGAFVTGDIWIET